MTVTTHYIASDEEKKNQTKSSGFDGFGRLCARFMGLALIFAALGIWLAPGASWATEVLVFKAGVSVFFALTGLSLALAGDNEARD